jgi:hypothetical protein
LGIALKKLEWGDIKTKFYDPINYAYNGKIEEFVTWVGKHNEKLVKYTTGDIIHIIGHSNLMKAGLEQIDEELGATNRYKLKAKQLGILETNAWSLKINSSNINTIELFKGIPKKVKTDPNWKDAELCGKFKSNMKERKAASDKEEEANIAALEESMAELK